MPVEAAVDFGRNLVHVNQVTHDDPQKRQARFCGLQRVYLLAQLGVVVARVELLLVEFQRRLRVGCDHFPRLVQPLNGRGLQRSHQRHGVRVVVQQQQLFHRPNPEGDGRSAPLAVFALQDDRLAHVAHLVDVANDAAHVGRQLLLFVLGERQPVQLPDAHLVP